METLRFDNRKMPIISSYEYDNWAEAFLKEYCPKALSSPVEVPILDIMRKKMRLKVNFYEPISRSGDIFGFIAFSDTEFPIYSKEKNENIITKISKGTVLIDTSSGHTGKIRNNLAHEAVHYAFHLPFYQFNLKEKGIESIRCSKENPISKTTEIDFLEIQARAIAPRILMPKKMFVQKAREILEKSNHLSNKDFCMKLAHFFGTSIQSANIRLKEVGFNVAPVDYSSYDFNKFCVNPPSFQPITTDTIDLGDALHLFLKDKEFRNLVSTGRFHYRDHRFYSKNRDETITFLLGEKGMPGNCLFNRRKSSTKVYRPISSNEYERLKTSLESYLEKDVSDKTTFSIVCREKLKQKHINSPLTFAERTGIENRNVIQKIK